MSSEKHKRKLSKETRERMSKAKIGNTNGSGNKGKKHTEEAKKKMSEVKIGNQNALGHKLSKEHKKKLKKSLEGYKHSEEVRERISEGNKRYQEEHGNPFAGRKHTEKTKGRIREANKDMVGNKAPNWQGGISFEPYSPEFNENLKEVVRERDGYICQLCGKTQRENGRKLTVHHVDYDKQNCSLDNLVALCISCNGMVNADRDYWTDYFKEMISVQNQN